MEQAYDYKKLMTVILDEISDKLQLPCIETNSQGSQPAYPFYTFDIADPHIELPFTDNVDFEEFECAIEFMSHSKSGYEATNMAVQLSKLFKTAHMAYIGAQHNFYVIDVEDVESSDNIITLQVERRSAFTLNLRICDEFVDELDPIEDIEINGSHLKDKPHKTNQAD